MRVSKVTDRRFPHLPMKQMAPVIFPSIANIRDLYFGGKNRQSNNGSNILEKRADGEIKANDTSKESDNEGELIVVTPIELLDSSVPSKRKSKKRGRKPAQKKKSLKRLERPGPIQIDETPYWEVEHIVDKRWVNNNPQYLVKWKGYSSADNTWEPLDSFHHMTMDCIYQYEYLNAPENLRLRNDLPTPESKNTEANNPSTSTQITPAEEILLQD